MTTSTRLLLSITEHFRAAIIPNQPQEWMEQLPKIPYTDDELKTILVDQQQRDELAVLAQLSRLGSMSSWIITYLGLTRDVIQEALNTLREDRKVQSNLMEILSATRYKTLTPEGLRDTKCPLQRCHEKDTFCHMLQCYDLEQRVEPGSASAHFLVYMARKTQILDPHTPRLFAANPEE